MMHQKTRLWLYLSRPSSTNGTRYNDKKIKRLVEPIEIRALEEMEDLSMGKYLFFVSAQDACRAKRTLAKILIVVFGSVSTRGPFWMRRKVAMMMAAATPITPAAAVA